MGDTTSMHPHIDAATGRRSILNYVSGAWVGDDEQIAIRHKFTGMDLGSVAVATPEQIDRAIAGARRVADDGPLPTHRMHGILYAAAAWLRDHEDEIGVIIAQESGKEIRQARGEVVRSAQTLELSADAGRSLAGHVVPIASSPGFDHAVAFTMRKPVGVVCAITPFNSPLNLVTHKIGPALAAGNAVVLKPSELTPTPSALIAHALERAGLPADWLQVVNGSGASVGNRLLDDARFDLYSFTGSHAVGRAIKQRVGLRRVVLELGNNSGTIVHHDAHVDQAARECARQAFSNSGQVCISVQRVYVHRAVVDAFVDRVVEATRLLRMGNPEEEGVDVGPMISEDAALRAEATVAEAVALGATVHVGGTRRGRAFEPTVLTGVPETARAVCEEVFAPILTILPYDDLDDAFDRVNRGPFGLQCGVFTANVETAFRAANALRMGGVIINGSSRFRADAMPYGGIKESGEGREGPAYAVRDMTSERLVVFNLPGPEAAR